ncbi:hypothetical protein QN366_02410 [Pseudomonas sp. CCC3.2]|uniref:hypothetical protein n=1 Tax=unclassified Pseudomonas TaxID=196821 RepID=UPI002AB37028|nr:MULTISPECIES: hypothetical protein [unclassified Pseudomonas]MDY7561394.1 hypothetical protein [Pseudomonas sp. AB6]MEB0178926.1 hypothetical protein [Pseudomonas sp. CCC3.2]MEB0210190.1 hypothetical protein [Pseudomonas sp. AB6]
MENTLQDKSVLYIAPRFFGYEDEIRDELIRRGAHVDFLLDRPFKSPFLKALTRIRRGWVIGAANRYYEKKTRVLVDRDYDFVFVISGQTLSDLTLTRWRNRYRKAIFVLYMWDSFSNRRWIVDNLHFFDHKFSFDRNDSEKYNIYFRPLFFSSGFHGQQEVAHEWDVSFIGTVHSDRFAVISKIAKTFDPSVRPFWYLFLQAKWVYWLYFLIKSSYRNTKASDFKFEPLEKGSVQAAFKSSKTILDIEHPKQTGLTMRTLETLGARKKLITTNISIKEYDFFNENNICVIDREIPTVPRTFLESTYVELDCEIYHKYSLKGWMDEIFLEIKNKSDPDKPPR